MPLDFRYHLASLAAVFGALLIGILLGVAMKEGPALSNQVQALRQEFTRAETLRNIDKRADQFNVATGRAIIRERLAGRNIALVGNPLPDTVNHMEAMQTALEEAGAKVTIRLMLKPTLRELPQDRLTAIAQEMGLPEPSDHITMPQLLQRLARSIGVDSPETIVALKRHKLLSVTGDPTIPVSAIVYIGGTAEDNDFIADIDAPFLRACIDRGITVAATEPYSVPRSAIPQYQSVTPLTVDNIDRMAGRIALVLALADGQQGNFGYKKTADEVSPECGE